MARNDIQVFETMPIRRAVLSLTIPTVISQMITVIYNMADTFFIGQLNQPIQVAAATLAMPPFIFLTGFANLFGIGAASVISRDLGKGERSHAQRAASFSIYGGLAVALIYALLIFIGRPILLPAIGTNAETYPYVYQYLLWTTVIGAVPTIMNALLAHLVRTEGHAKEAGFGLMLGGILNIVLDPVFIFGFHMEIRGAAIATLLSNMIAALYFVYLIIHSKESVISFQPKYFTLRDRIPYEVITQGLPSFIMTLMSFISNTVLNSLVASYSNVAMAGMGIAKKIDMIGFAVAQGMTQGVLALIGYNYASGNHKRMKQAIRLTLIYSLSIAGIGAIALFLFAQPIARLFIQDTQTVWYGQRFLRIICMTIPATSVTMMIITVFQATGYKKQPMFLSMMRKGCLDVPLMLLLSSAIGVTGIAWATPVADLTAMLLAIALYTAKSPYQSGTPRMMEKNEA